MALGQQVGAGARERRPDRRLQARTVELARLSARMVEQHEEERRRLSRELHDETAQVFSAVKMELGVLRDGVPPERRRDGSTTRWRWSTPASAGIRSVHTTSGPPCSTTSACCRRCARWWPSSPSGAGSP